MGGIFLVLAMIFLLLITFLVVVTILLVYFLAHVGVSDKAFDK